jgi:hypothetical protein
LDAGPNFGPNEPSPLKKIGAAVKEEVKNVQIIMFGPTLGAKLLLRG